MACSSGGNARERGFRTPGVRTAKTSADAFDDMRREKDDTVFAKFGQEIEEPNALGWVEAGRRLVNDHEHRVPEQRLRTHLR